ncbi:MAG: glycosyltransferase [Rhodobacteraceae bacterium]|nr:glycosyltransferase [Paracoccaceae bacterium]
MKQLRETVLTIKSRYRSSRLRKGGALKLGGDTLGYIEKITPEAGQMRVEGWYFGPDLKIMNNGIVTPIDRHLLRADVARVHDIPVSEKTGFSVLLTPSDRLCVQPCNPAKKTTHPDLVLFSRADKCRAALATMVFLPVLFLQNPVTVLRFLLSGDRKAAGILDKKMQLGSPENSIKTFDMSIFDPEPSIKTALDQTEIAIILPVYNSFELLKECLTRVITHTKPPYRLILVEDCSTDKNIRPWLRQWVKTRDSSVLLLENNQNLGFIASVNRGLTAAGDRHVVLLNSDAFVPQGWLPRLIHPILQDNNIASTTPLSNNAEILSLPIICKDNPLNDGAVDRIDSIAQTLNRRQPFVEMPTGIGFCMGMNKRFIKKIPQLDRRFGKGYGEEVDWCQKTRAIGGTHMAVTNLFVHHKGGESFGPEKQAALAKNGAVISRLYPRFDQLVQNFIAADPLKSTRFALALPAIDTGQPVPVFLTHEQGGGAEVYLKNRIQKEHKNGQAVIVIRDRVSAAKYQIELHTPVGITSCMVSERSEIKQLLAPIRSRGFFYTCLVGSRSPLKFMDEICNMIDPKQDSLSVQLHDFFPICPSHNLLDQNAEFCKLPRRSACETCFRKNTGFITVKSKSIGQWRQNWDHILTHANRVEVFSTSGKTIFAKAYPQHASKIKVVPHELPEVPDKINPGKYKSPVIGVLGNIGLIKGAEFIQQAAAANKKSGRIVVIGNMDPKYSHPDIAVTGTYQVKNLAKIAKSNGINCWLIASICPETFSYTTHEAIHTGLPVFCFDLGAQAEAVKKAKNGYIIPNRPETLFSEIDSHLNPARNLEKA